MIPEPMYVRNLPKTRLGTHECFICGERKPTTALNASGVLVPLCDACRRFLREEERINALRLAVR